MKNNLIKLIKSACVIFLIGCHALSNLEAQQPTPSPASTSTRLESPTLIPPVTTNSPSATPTPHSNPSPTATQTALQIPEKLLALNRVVFPSEGNPRISDLWLFDSILGELHPFQVHDENYTYCCPVWSPDGQWIAFARTTINKPDISSLWIARPDGSETRMVGEEARYDSFDSPGHSEITPIRWSHDGAQVVYGNVNDVLIVDIETNEIEELDLIPELLDLGLESPYSDPGMIGMVMPFTANTDRLILGANLVTGVYFLQTTFSDPNGDIQLLIPPDGYPVPYSLGNNLSPDGSFLAIGGISSLNGDNYLELVDLRTNDWSIALTTRTDSLLSYVSWSPDQKWVAWWNLSKDLQGTNNLVLLFVETQTWEISRQINAFEMEQEPEIVGWTTDAEGNAGFAVFGIEPEMGLMLLSPGGNKINDLQIVGFQEFSKLMPFNLDEIFSWSWQP